MQKAQLEERVLEVVDHVINGGTVEDVGISSNQSYRICPLPAHTQVSSIAREFGETPIAAVVQDFSKVADNVVGHDDEFHYAAPVALESTWLPAPFDTMRHQVRYMSNLDSDVTATCGAVLVNYPTNDPRVPWTGWTHCSVCLCQQRQA